jgi:hypothetical protein
MDNPTSHGQAELERFAKLWGLVRLAQVNEDDRMADRELFHLSLVCSMNFVDWTRVYKAFPDTQLTLDQLMQAARKVGHPGESFSVDKSWPVRMRDASVMAELFCGACFSEAAKQTTLYKELHEALAPVEYCTDALEVVAFHLVGVPNLVAVVEDLRSPFVLQRMPNARREMVIDILRRLHGKWSKNNADQVSAEVVIMISECQYPFLDTMSDAYTTIKSLTQKQKNAGTGNTTTTTRPSATLSAAARAKMSSQQALGTLNMSVPRPWSLAVERAMADNPRFRRYKQRKGWPAFYPSRETVLAYLNEMSIGDKDVVEDCKTMSSRDLIQLTLVLAPHVETVLFVQTAQGKDFVRAMTATATPQQISSWSTLDAAQRLLVVHHPDWQTHYSHAWNLDRTTVTEMTAYRERWPKLPDPLLAHSDDDEDSK